MNALTPAQRTSLPDATLVRLTTGRVASLGVLRSEHRARMQRFATAASADRLVRTGADHAGAPSTLNKLVPMKPVKGGPVDFVSYCRSVLASACLYLPPSLGLAYDAPSDSFVDTDFDVTRATCKSEGGKWDGSDCNYYYPAGYHGSFNPGPPPPGEPIGYGVTSAQHCGAGKFQLNVDPKGAFSFIAVGKTPSIVDPARFYLTTGPSAWMCYADVVLL
jgi:hypothetical protein